MTSDPGVFDMVRGPRLPCRGRPDLFFSDNPARLEVAKTMCRACPVRESCLNGALARREAAGVWGGQIFDHGRAIAIKRRRGRPRKTTHGLESAGIR